MSRTPPALRSIRGRLAFGFGTLLVLAALDLGALYWGSLRRAEAYAGLSEALRRHAVLTEARVGLDDHYRRVHGGAAGGAEAERLAASLDAVGRALAAESGAPPAGLRDGTLALLEAWKQVYAAGDAGSPAARVALADAEPLAQRLLGVDLPAAIHLQSTRVDAARAEYERVDARSRRVLWGMLLLTGLLCAGLAYSLTRDLLAALRALKVAAERFGGGDLAHRVTVPRLAELEEVAASLNAMAGRLRQTRDELEVRNEELAQLAYCDPLTRLGNRALFRRGVEHALGVEGCRPEEVAVLFLDLDNFKAVNDSLGHAAGDRLLVEVAVRIRRVSHGSATVARLGGDEFAILLAPVRAPGEAVVTAENVIVAVEAPLVLDGRRVHVAASIGVAFGRPGGGADELLRDADVAMYRAKAAGKGRYEVFAPEMHTALLHRMELEVELRGALERGEMVVRYEPVVELAAGRIRGFEALLRWQHPTRGLIPPAMFIPLAEESGTIVALGRWVLEQACREGVRWQAAMGENRWVSVGVNVSGTQLESPRLVDEVRQALEASGLPAGCLVLEITESTIMRDSQATLRRMRELKELGVWLAVDDFGTGYSSLAYLQRFPVDILKIDKAFIDSVAHGGNDAALARTIVTLAEMLHLVTVAEGIEEAEQMVQLRGLGCALGQGYLFGPALTGEEAYGYLLAALGSGPEAVPLTG